jgi:hypothetical protein
MRYDERGTRVRAQVPAGVCVHRCQQRRAKRIGGMCQISLLV